MRGRRDAAFHLLNMLAPAKNNKTCTFFLILQFAQFVEEGYTSEGGPRFNGVMTHALEKWQQANVSQFLQRH